MRKGKCGETLEIEVLKGKKFKKDLSGKRKKIPNNELVIKCLDTQKFFFIQKISLTKKTNPNFLILALTHFLLITLRSSHF